MDIKQGNTIQFISVFKASSTVDATSWDDVDNVIIYAYTCDSYIVKFSLLPISGYNKLIRIDSTHLLGAITPQQSKLMLGELMMELCIKDKGSVLLDGGTSVVTELEIVDGGDSSTTPALILDGGNSANYNVEEIGINGIEVGITITESIIKAEV